MFQAAPQRSLSNQPGVPQGGPKLCHTKYCKICDCKIQTFPVIDVHKKANTILVNAIYFVPMLKKQPNSVNHKREIYIFPFVILGGTMSCFSETFVYYTWAERYTGWQALHTQLTITPNDAPDHTIKPHSDWSIWLMINIIITIHCHFLQKHVITKKMISHENKEIKI